MKLGILTLHWVYNFGAALQAFSTYASLKARGHQPIILDYRSVEECHSYLRTVNSEQRMLHDNFLRAELDMSRCCFTSSELAIEAASQELDGIILGSDAVLRLREGSQRSDLRFPNPYWLTWMEHHKELNSIPRALFAGSAMGSNYSQFSPATKDGIFKALTKFGVLSVRDEWTRLMLQSVGIGKERSRMCADPVFLLNEHVARFPVPDRISEMRNLGSGYVIISFSPGRCTRNWASRFVRAAHQRGYSVVSLPMPEGEMNLPVDLSLNLPMDPVTWYNWIANASAYVGERFHPVIISIARGVPFFVLDTYITTKGLFTTDISSKVVDLCRAVDLERQRTDRLRFRFISPTKILEKVERVDKSKLVSEGNFWREDVAVCLDQILAGFKSGSEAYA